MDQFDGPTRPRVPERSTKLPRIIIKPTITTGATLPRGIVATNPMVHLQDNETYQRLLARREKMPLPGESSNDTRIPSVNRTRVIVKEEIVQKVNMPDAAITKLWERIYIYFFLIYLFYLSLMRKVQTSKVETFIVCLFVFFLFSQTKLNRKRGLWPFLVHYASGSFPLTIKEKKSCVWVCDSVYFLHSYGYK